MRATIRKATVVAAHGIVALALLAGCDGDDRAEATKPSTHQRLQAEDHEWSAHLEGQARTHADGGRVGRGSVAVAEQLEHSAKLDGQARTHGNVDSNDDAPGH